MNINMKIITALRHISVYKGNANSYKQQMGCPAIPKPNQACESIKSSILLSVCSVREGVCRADKWFEILSTVLVYMFYHLDMKRNNQQNQQKWSPIENVESGQ